MSKIRISIVSYLNSKPFIAGLENAALKEKIDLALDIPSVIAKKLIAGDVDLGLIPVAVIPLLKEAHIVSDYCIGASGKVASVMLYSQVPLNEITSVLLDYQSRTSVSLVRVLAQNFWKIRPEWILADEKYEEQIAGTTAAVIIGDRTFGLVNKYKFSYDLAEEWQKFTGLPFVFACWVANKELPADFIKEFNTALKTGLDMRTGLARDLQKSHKYAVDIATYLLQNIDYDYDLAKRKGLELFLSYQARLEQ